MERNDAGTEGMDRYHRALSQLMCFLLATRLVTCCVACVGSTVCRSTCLVVAVVGCVLWSGDSDITPLVGINNFAITTSNPLVIN
jgi:hypothetical protein